MSRSKLIKYLRDVRVLAMLSIAYGFSYIPVFIHGYFWLWVFPFVAIVTLFVRAMISSAIDQVSKAGDEAVQAKAMIPKFIMMNVKMTVLLSLPFITALYLVEHGHIENLRVSDTDRAIWEWCLGVLKSSSKIGMLDLPFMQIVLSNLFFMIVCTVSLFTLAYKKIKQVFVILFHRESYKFLQDICPVARVSRLRWLLAAAAYIPLLLIPLNASLNAYSFCFYMGFLVFVQFANVISLKVEYLVRLKDI
ncbi:MAG: hypothetical protein ACRBB3_07835 [Alphaproteobacteria bacterium]